jgi:hypothetical protein
MITADGNQINMALTVQKVIAKYSEVWNTHQGFTTQVSIMQRLLDVIKAHQQNAEVKTEGVTRDKANAAAYAIEMGLELACSALVYAKAAKNETLKAQFRIPKKTLTNVQGVVTVSRLKELHANLTAIIDNLQDNVTQEELEAFGTAISAFEGQVVNPRGVVIDRERSNEMVAESVKSLKSTFEDMDNLISKFKRTPFKEEYKLARKIIDLGTRKGGKGNDEEPEALNA